MKTKHLLTMTLLSTLACSSFAIASTASECKIQLGGTNARLDALVAQKIAQRPAAQKVEIKGFGERFRISETELREMDKVSDEQVAKMVELALDAERPNALNEAAVESALQSVAAHDPNVAAFIQDNALLSAKQSSRLAREIKLIDGRSVQEIQTALKGGELSTEAKAVLSLDQLMKALQENGGKVGLKVRAGTFLTSLPKVGRFFESAVDSTVTLADRVNEIVKALDESMLQIQTNTNTLANKRDAGIRLLDNAAREVTLLQMMLAKLDSAIKQVEEVDEVAARKLQSQGRLRIASLLEGKQGFMVGIHVGNKAFDHEISMNHALIQQVDLTKMTTVPITAQTLTLRANQAINTQYMNRIEAIQEQTKSQLLAMNQGMKETAIRAVQLAKKSTLDPATLMEIENNIGQIKGFLEKGFIEAADQKIADMQAMQVAMQKSLNVLSTDGRTTVEDVQLKALTNETANVITDLTQASQLAKVKIHVRK